MNKISYVVSEPINVGMQLKSPLNNQLEYTLHLKISFTFSMNSNISRSLVNSIRNKYDD